MTDDCKIVGEIDGCITTYIEVLYKHQARIIMNYIKSRYHTLCRCPETIALKGFWGPILEYSPQGNYRSRCLIAPGFFRFPRALPVELKGIAV